MQILDCVKTAGDLLFINNVKKKSVFDRLVHWIKEREGIRILKDARQPQPWTEDPILRTYRFCNVRRMDDLVSRWLFDSWFKPYYNHPNMLFAVALARFINNPDSLSLITESVFKAGNPLFASIKAKLRKHRDSGGTVFNGAYMVRGNDGQDKIECVVDHYVKPLTTLPLRELNTDSMEEAWTQLSSYYGFGSFMAGQVVADLRWAVEGSWHDRMTWAPIGPGSNRGMARLYQESANPPYKQNDFCEMLTELIENLRKVLPAIITDRVEAHDYQNCLCEFDKYERTLWGEGKPKQLYRSKS